MEFTNKINIVGRSVRIWQDRDGKYRWEYRSNGKAMAQSVNGFRSLQGCKNNALSVAYGMRKV